MIKISRILLLELHQTSKKVSYLRGQKLKISALLLFLAWITPRVMIADACAQIVWNAAHGTHEDNSVEKFLNQADLEHFKFEANSNEEGITRFCQELAVKFRSFGWDANPCGSVKFDAALRSNRGHPLLFSVFGNGRNRTLVLSGVHPDELTPVPMGFRFAKYLESHPEKYSENDQSIVIAPLVNPDGFLIEAQTRTNSNGVDLNRNFFTLDWYANAHQFWEQKRKKDKRYFPGIVPNSEIETYFQQQLIAKFQPQKILSIHAPLGFLDYDGPGDGKPESKDKHVKSARDWVNAISKSTKNYRVVDYSFYPGSIGNYGGNERNIPTVTLELKSTDASKIEEYWQSFLPGLIKASSFSISVAEFAQKENSTSSAQISPSQSGARALE